MAATTDELHVSGEGDASSKEGQTRSSALVVTFGVLICVATAITWDWYYYLGATRKIAELKQHCKVGAAFKPIETFALTRGHKVYSSTAGNNKVIDVCRRRPITGWFVSRLKPFKWREIIHAKLPLARVNIYLDPSGQIVQVRYSY
jgi:hypothetical protein